MENNERPYTGFVSLEKSLKTVVMTSKTKKAYFPRTGISWEKYSKIRSWMRLYAERVTTDDDKNLTIIGKPTMPSVSELRKEFGLTATKFLSIVKKYDTGRIVHVKEDIDKKEEEEFFAETGLRKGDQYLILKSLYSYLFRDQEE